MRKLLFRFVQRISLHFKSPDLYLSCTTKVFPKFLLPFQCQASFQSEQFGCYDHAPRSLSLVACSLSSQRSLMLTQTRPLLQLTITLKARLHVKREGTARLETSTGSRRNLLFTRTNFVMCPTEKGTVLESPLERVLDCLHVVFFETGNDRASDN